MKRWLVTCSYDGSAFAGWQSQKNKRCIQSEIEKAIACFDKNNHLIVGCSRTDAKVHALGQRFHWDSGLTMNADQVVRALNCHLPPDIRALAAEEVAVDFHARYSAVAKHYEYLINNGQYNVLMRNYQTYVKEKLAVEKMRQAAAIFIGEHDFTTFCATTLDEKDNQVRTIYAISINQEGDLLRIKFDGNGFLRYMVRMLSQTLIEVGKGKITYAQVATMLAAQDKRACRYNSKPEGLYLVAIDY